MNRKLFISLAPLLAIVAFAVMPAAAQAVPHVYKNGVISAEGKKVREIWWGTLKFVTNLPYEEEFECHSVFAGYAENPTGGGAGVGKVQAADAYECVTGPGCVSVGGKGTEFTAEALPWSVEITEPEPGAFRMRTGKKGATEAKEPEAVGFGLACIGVYERPAQLYGEWAPKIQNNGLAIGSAPGELEFDEPGGKLGGEGELKTYGKVKLEGYAAEELIEVKNP